ncbi:hypothetical protein ACGC1H_002614 [Rhizoctonia solani]
MPMMYPNDCIAPKSGVLVGAPHLRMAPPVVQEFQNRVSETYSMGAQRSSGPSSPALRVQHRVLTSDVGKSPHTSADLSVCIYSAALCVPPADRHQHSLGIVTHGATGNGRNID